MSRITQEAASTRELIEFVSMPPSLEGGGGVSITGQQDLQHAPQQMQASQAASSMIASGIAIQSPSQIQDPGDQQQRLLSAASPAASHTSPTAASAARPQTASSGHAGQNVQPGPASSSAAGLHAGSYIPVSSVFAAAHAQPILSAPIASDPATSNTAAAMGEGSTADEGAGEQKPRRANVRVQNSTAERFRRALEESAKAQSKVAQAHGWPANGTPAQASASPAGQGPAPSQTTQNMPGAAPIAAQPAAPASMPNKNYTHGRRPSTAQPRTHGQAHAGTDSGFVAARSLQPVGRPPSAIGEAMPPAVALGNAKTAAADGYAPEAAAATDAATEVTGKPEWLLVFTWSMLFVG